MWNVYPYKNLTDLNLDFILKAIGEMENQVKNFVALNAIKYADPIQWDITRSYEKNTVVIDGHSGVAYISVAPVPFGVSLTRPEYWTVVFDLSSFITKGAANFANSYESQPTTTATMDTNEGEWVVWDSTLFEALTDIHAGDAYVVDGNIKKMTVEDFYNILVGLIQTNTQDISDEITNRQNEDIRIELELRDLVVSKVGDLTTLTTSNKDSAVDAINEVNANVGNLSTLTTTDKDSAVDAINEIDAIVKGMTDLYLNVKDYGAVGDGINDDTLAVQAAIDDMCDKGLPLVFPKGAYLITSPLTATPPYFSIYGISQTETILAYNGAGYLFDISTTGSPTFRNVKIQNFTIRAKNTNCNGFNFKYVNGLIVRDVLIRGFKVGINSEICYCVEATKIKFFESPNTYIDGQLCLRDASNNWAVNSCSFSLENSDPDNYSALILNPSANISFNDCAFEYGGGIFVRNNDNTAPIRNVGVNDCYFEWIQRNCVRTHSSASLIYNMTIRNCYFNAKYGDNSLGYAIDVPAVYGLSVDTCNIRNYTNGILNFNRGTPNGYTVNNCVTSDNTIPIVSSNMELNAITGIANAAPTTGIHNKGEIVLNLSPSGATPTIGWICTVGGTSGTWVAIVAN